MTYAPGTSGKSGTAWIVAALCAGNFLAYFDRSILSAVLPLVKADFHLSDWIMGFLQGSLFAFAYVAASVGCWMIPSRAAPFVLLGGLAAWTLGEATAALCTSAAQLAVAQILVGLGQAGFIPVALSALTVQRDKVGVAVSLFAIGSTLGRCVSVLCMGLALVAVSTVHAGASWRSLYGSVASAGLILLIVMTAVVYKNRSNMDALRQPDRILVAGFAPYLRPCLTIFAIALPVILVVQSLSAWMPTLIARGYGTGVPRAAILVGAVTLSTSPVGLLFGGWLVDRRLSFAPRPLPVISGCMIVACAGVWGLTYADSLRSTLLAFAVVNIVLGIATLTCLATLQKSVPPSQRPRINALFLAFATAIGFGLGPLLVGMLSDIKHGDAAALGSAFRIITGAATAACLTVSISSLARQLGNGPSFA